LAEEFPLRRRPSSGGCAATFSRWEKVYFDPIDRPFVRWLAADFAAAIMTTRSFRAIRRRLVKSA
jgi:hypothetical protein